jgi:vancomycin permeability regulator SanA
VLRSNPVGFIRRHRILTGAFVLLLLVIAVLGTTAFAVWNAAHHDDSSVVDHADVIVVLGAAQYNGHPSPVFQGRLEQAATLFDHHFAPDVLVLGSNQPGDRTTEGAAGRAWLIDHGLPATQVYAQPVGNDTLQSLKGAASFMRDHRMRSAFLVSDPWHNLRIRRMASDLGIQAYVSATWHSAARSQSTRLDGYTRETFAYLYYRLLHH